MHVAYHTIKTHFYVTRKNISALLIRDLYAIIWCDHNIKEIKARYHKYVKIGSHHKATISFFTNSMRLSNGIMFFCYFFLNLLTKLLGEIHKSLEIKY